MPAKSLSWLASRRVRPLDGREEDEREPTRIADLEGAVTPGTVADGIHDLDAGAQHALVEGVCVADLDCNLDTARRLEGVVGCVLEDLDHAAVRRAKERPTPVGVVPVVRHGEAENIPIE